MNKKTFIALIIAFTGVCTFLFYVFYNEARTTAIKHTNEAQMVHAKVAARGIEEYFTNWIGILDALSKTDDIINNNSDGKRLIKLLYDAHLDKITSIARLNEKGIITYSPSYDSIIGNDRSNEKHIKELLKHHKTIISDVFTPVEGGEAIALHVPIFKGKDFKGSIGILINFKTVAKCYLADIRIGKTGHAWVVSRDGIELYSPEPGFVGKSAAENLKDFPSFTPMLNEMLKGRQGYATYQFDQASGQKIKLATKLAVYTPVHLKNTFWSIVVVSNRDEALQSLVSFRNRLLVIILVFFIFGMIFITFGTKAWLIVKEEDKRKKAEAQLKESEEQYHKIYDNALEGMFQVSLEGKCFKANMALAKIMGHDSIDAVFASTRFNDDQLWVDNAEKSRYIKLFNEQDVILGFESQFKRVDGAIIWVSINTKLLRDENGNKLYYEGFILDITERKENELTIKKKMEELQWHYDIAINRELKMVELKKEINSLLEELNRDKKYN
ncbi:MAG: PAS domain S-box protein [Paludibacter sp.]|nr:PAS domain S-box protein [Paludibacter sp.]